MAEPRGDQVERVAALLERLLTEPAFRTAFRRDPIGTCRACGLDGLAEELVAGGKALETLELRESRSSLAGVVLAAAAEGVGAGDLLQHVRGRGDAAQALDRALSSPRLRAVAPATVRALPAVAEPAAAPPESGVEPLLHDSRLGLDADARGDLLSGRVDPRVVALLARLSEKHEIGLSVIKTGHAAFVAGTHSHSNHFFGRAFDIASVDGRPVDPSNAAARAVALELGRVAAELRPTEIGSPWNLGGYPYFTDAHHQDHIHVGYDTAPPPGLELEAPVPATPAAPSAPSSRATAGFAAAPVPVAAVPEAPHEHLEHAAEAPSRSPDAGSAGPVPPIAPEDMRNTNLGGKLHGSEFDVPDAEGAPGPHGRLHAGYDLFARGGASVRSPVAGTIVEVKASRGSSGQIFGGVVKVQGADGRVWVFRHVDPLTVREGRRVEPGAEIARVTDWTDGPSHSHLELWKTLDGGYDVANMEDPLGELRKAYDGSAASPEPAPPPAAAPPPTTAEQPGSAVHVALPAEAPPPVRATVRVLPAVAEPAAVVEAVDAYPGNGAPREQIAAWMADRARAAGLPPELPVMAALVESGLRNLPGGDRDSVGFFQMRVGIWNQGAYAGYPDDPELQLKWFIDRALAVQADRPDRAGHADRYGEWIADIERPAEQYRGRYQLRLDEARALLAPPS